MRPDRNGREPDLARQAAPLSVYWNAVVDGTEPETADVDLELAGVVRRLHATPSAPALTPARQEQIWQALIASPVADDRPGPIPGPTASPNGRELVVLARPVAAPPNRRGWLVAQLATAALLLLTLISGYLAFVRPHHTSPSAVPPGIISRVDSSRAPILPVGVVDDVTLIAATIEAMPPGGKPYWGSVSRSTLAPGAEESVGAVTDSGIGPLVYTVEAGRVTVIAAGPVAVTRGVAAGANEPETVPVGREVVLDAGDQLAAASGVTLRRRNDGPEPATMLGFSIVHGNALETPGALFIGDFADIPFLMSQPAPVRVALRRLTLAPDGSIPLHSLPGLQLLYVESGTAALEPFAPDGSLDPGRGYPVRARTGTSHFDGNAGQTMLINRGTEPIVVLIATVTSPDAVPSPASTIAAMPLPAGVTADATILQATADTMPDDVVDMIVERFTLEPGAVVRAGAREDMGVGPYLFVVESGRVTVDADAPVMLTRRDANGAAPAAIPAGTHVGLDVGDQLFAPEGVAFRRRNEGTTPARLLEFRITATGDSPIQPGVVATHCEACRSAAMRPEIAPAVLALRQLTLAPEARLPIRDMPGVQLVAVEHGAVVLIYNEDVAASAFGGSLEVAAGEFGFADLGPTPDKAVLTNESTEPAVILVATITAAPAAPDQPPAAGFPVGVSADETRLRSTIDTMPRDVVDIDMGRTVLDPGAVESAGALEDSGVGPHLFVVESGQLTVDADAPVVLIRQVSAGAEAPVTIPALTSIVLDVGDQLLVPQGVTFRRRNDGSTPATLYELRIAHRGEYRYQPGIVSTGEGTGKTVTMPSPIEPAVAAVQQFTLEPGTVLPVADLPGLELVDVMSGAIDYIYNGSLDTAGFGSSTKASPGSGGVSDLGPTPDKAAIANNGTEPAVILAATITAPRPGGDDARQAGDAGFGEVLLQGTFDVIPDQTAWIGVERTTLAPGAEWELGRPSDQREGPMLYAVESGTLTITTDGTIVVTRAGEGEATNIAAGAPATLDPGDRGFTPSGVASRWRNDGDTPVTVLNTFVSTPDSGDALAGITNEVLIDQWPVALPPPPLTVELRQMALLPGKAFVPANVPGLRGFFVANGVVEVQDAGGRGTPAGSFRIPTGASRAFGGGGYESAPSSWTLRAADGEPATMLIMTIADANPLEQAPMG